MDERLAISTRAARGSRSERRAPWPRAISFSTLPARADPKCRGGITRSLVRMISLDQPRTSRAICVQPRPEAIHSRLGRAICACDSGSGVAARGIRGPRQRLPVIAADGEKREFISASNARRSADEVAGKHLVPWKLSAGARREEILAAPVMTAAYTARCRSASRPAFQAGRLSGSGVGRGCHGDEAVWPRISASLFLYCRSRSRSPSRRCRRSSASGRSAARALRASPAASRPWPRR